ncbi:MAG: hypothetical protein RIR25_1012, partial [Verrucomicrobiota bacterium]
DEALPKSWATVKLAEVGTWRGGGTPSKSNSAFWTAGTIPWVSPKDMKVPKLSTAQDFITESAVDSSATNLVSPHSVLLVTRSGILAHSLPTAVNLVSVALNQDLKAVTPHRFADSEFLRLSFRCFERDILNACRKGGTTVHSIEFPALQDFTIPLPPLAEQKRIVAKIEELFSELEAGEESLRLARRQLATYRQSLLKQAFEGKLTQTWRTQNPDKLESPTESNIATDELEGFPDLPESWRYTRFGESIRHIDAGKSFRCEERRPTPDEIGVAKVSAVTWGEYDEAESKTCIDPEKVNPDYFIRSGDFILSRANTIELVGACVIVHKVTQRVMLSDKTLRLTIADALKPFFLHYLRSRHGRREIEKRSTGNQESMRNIGQDRIRSIVVPECSLPEQQEIVRLLNEQFEAIERNEQELDVALQRSEALRQAILKKAFTGRLVPQDPADEPATELLARLQEERAPSTRLVRKKTRP